MPHFDLEMKSTLLSPTLASEMGVIGMPKSGFFSLGVYWPNFDLGEWASEITQVQVIIFNFGQGPSGTCLALIRGDMVSDAQGKKLYGTKVFAPRK